MPFACPLPFTRRVGQAIVNRHVLRLTELRHLPHPAQSSSSRSRHCSSASHASHAFVPVSSSVAAPLVERVPSPEHGHEGGASSKSRRAVRIRGIAWSKRTPISLRSALLDAADKHVAPPLHGSTKDVSFASSNRYTWELHTTESRAVTNATTQHKRRDYDVPTLLQALLAKAVAQYTEHAVAAATGTTTIIAPDQDTVSQHGPSHHQLGLESVTVTAEDEELLSAHGYTVNHLRDWITILTTMDSLKAASLLTTANSTSAGSSLKTDNETPYFIYLYFLRRQQISPEALRLLVEYMPIWFGRFSSSAEANDLVFRSCIRLFRHARRVWPESLSAIAHHLTVFLRLGSRAQTAVLQGEMPTPQIARLTTLFNRALYLCSEPTRVEPFKSAILQEATQAVILRHMAEHDPPLIINREGYRGVIRAQLVHKKSPNEKEWARLKSPSWPPWKEDRTGMDADVGLEYGISRARNVLNRMQEAGYGIQLWESTALIYAGWDSDSSPTIQTRAIMPDPDDPRIAFQLWAARIRSTRTVEQAWACFLSYEDEALDPDQDVYLAMFEKLVEDGKRHRLGHMHPSQREHHEELYPGDTKEVFSPPASTHQATYTKTPPPTVGELHKYMLGRGLAPSNRTLAFLIRTANSLNEGLGYLQSNPEYHSNPPRDADTVQRLVYRKFQPRHIETVPDIVFSAVVDLFMRFPHTALRHHKDGPSLGKYSFGGTNNLDLRQPLARAIYLLDVARRPYRPAWNALLRGLARRTAPTVWEHWSLVQDQLLNNEYILDKSMHRQISDKFASLNIAKLVVTKMSDMADLTLDVAGFRYFCIIVENAASAAASVLEDEAQAVTNLPEEQAKMLSQARAIMSDVHALQSQFWKLVGTSPPSESTPSPRIDISHTSTVILPRLLVTPSPAVLHAYIRAVGHLRDYDALEQLVVWMREYWPELSARKDEDKNGNAMLRKCIIALRVFLEGWLQEAVITTSPAKDDGQVAEQDSDGVENEESEAKEEVVLGAPVELIDRVCDVVDSVDEWGGWASDKEVERYRTWQRNT